MNNLDSLFICTTERQLSDVSNTVDSLQCQLGVMQDRYDVVMGIVETSNDSISNQLSAASILLAVIAIAIAVVGGVLGSYIRKKKLEIDMIAATIEEKKKTIDTVAVATEKLDKQIKGNLGELYLQLRNEETKAILDRLVLEPRDIGNLIKLLLARDLEEDGYAKVREAYLKLEQEPEEKPKDGLMYVKIGATSEESYNLLFFQHFCYQAIKDDEIRPTLVKGFKNSCQKAFKRDMIKTTIDLCKALSEKTASFNKEEVLIEYLKAINSSKHKSLVDLKNILEQNLMPLTLLENAKEKCKEDGVYLELFGITKPEEGKMVDGVTESEK